MCLYPKLIKNPRYKPNKKNKGIVPVCDDPRKLYVAIGCGKCIECMKKKSRDWQIRLNEEVTFNKVCTFVTLTFNLDNLMELQKCVKNTGDIIDNDIATLAVRRFLERWRKIKSKSVRHWLVTELGHSGTERIHLHGIIWSNELELIEKCWSYGYVYFGKWVNERTVNYIVKYIHKIDIQHKCFEPKVLTSSGIGSNYTNTYNSRLNSFNNEKTNECYKNRQGYKLSLPIYYRNKIYTESEREKLWINKLNKMERYVLGEKVSVENDDIEYNKLLLYAREINNELGYGNDSINFNKKLYKYQCNMLRYYKK